MSCGGCSGAVRRALGKMEGLEGYEVDLEKQEVVVRPATATYEQVLEKIKKTGKEVSCNTNTRVHFR
jgi:copper chaperone